MEVLVEMLGLVLLAAPLDALLALLLWARWLRRRTTAPRFVSWVSYVLLALAAVPAAAGLVAATLGVHHAMSHDISPADRQRVLASGIAEAFYDGVLTGALAAVVALWLLLGTWRWHWVAKRSP
jgi:hypothetical protein